jgi:hypothetical protein
MPMQPSHPDEPALHSELRDALNEGLTSTDFFVWLSIYPTGKGEHLATLPSIVESTEAWLNSLDPDSVSSGDMPEKKFVDPAGEVRIRAIPKKPEARAYRADQIVGNPSPMLVGWN